MLFLRSSLFTLGSILALFVVVPLGLLLAPFPYHIRYGWISQWARFNIRWVKLTCGIDYRIEGWEHVPKDAAIVFCKHQSTWETLIMQVLLPPQVWVLKRELLWVPVFGWGLALCRPIAIDRGAGRKAIGQIVEQGIERLRKGLWVIIFPEGTRVAPGQRKRYGVGGAVLAEQSGYPVLPIAHNAGEFWGRRQFIKRPGTVRLVFGPLIDTRGKSAQQINAEAEAWIEGTMARISTDISDPISRNS